MKQRPITPIAERFSEKWIPEPNSGCWLWTGAVSRSGYGIVMRGRKSEGQIRAHRASWKIYRGEIPVGMFVCHKCDVRSCVNPDHLWLGQHADNMADRNAKGRAARGERGGNAKLTDAQTIAIRNDQRTQMAIAAAFGISQSRVSQIKQET